MTWEQWVNSDYNTAGATMINMGGNSYYPSIGGTATTRINTGSGFVTASSVIINNGVYSVGM